MSSLFGIGAGSASTGFYPETIDQSLRLDGTSAHLSKTYSTTASSTTDFVMSLWFKAILSGTGDRMIASSYDGSTVMMYWQFQSDRKLRIYIDPSSAGSNEFHVTTDMVFRDSTN
jgi:TnpA family transposase